MQVYWQMGDDNIIYNQGQYKSHLSISYKIVTSMCGITLENVLNVRYSFKHNHLNQHQQRFLYSDQFSR